MLNVPATIGLIVLAHPIVALLLERGRFTPRRHRRHRRRADVLRAGLLGYSAVKIASPSFYSLRDSRTPVIVSVVAVLDQPRRSICCSCASWAIAGWRSAPRSRRCSTPGSLLWLLRAPARRPRRTARRASRFVKILAGVARDGRPRRGWPTWLARVAFPATRTSLRRAIRVLRGHRRRRASSSSRRARAARASRSSTRRSAACSRSPQDDRRARAHVESASRMIARLRLHPDDPADGRAPT